ncbi:MAG: hypothetical protein JW779_11880 [Candidatus Thorarchaeota archaeon]|nr:hypothetical protein [Candidatus Thorarchaeota archaeon]
MSLYEWKYASLAGMVSAIIAASVQIIAVLLQESPEPPIGLSVVVIISLLGASILLPASHVLHAKGRGVIPGIVLILTGLVLLVFTWSFHNLIASLFYPRTLVSGFIMVDSMFISLAGWILLMQHRGCLTRYSTNN